MKRRRREAAKNARANSIEPLTRNAANVNNCPSPAQKLRSPTKKRRSHASSRKPPRSRHLSPKSHRSSRRSHGHFESRRKLVSTDKRVANTPCKFFAMRRGCRYGERCKFEHTVPYRKSCRRMHGPLRSRDDRCTGKHSSFRRSSCRGEPRRSERDDRSKETEKANTGVTTAVANSLVQLVKAGCVSGAAKFVSALQDQQKH